jgi:hypothetical protein
MIRVPEKSDWADPIVPLGCPIIELEMDTSGVGSAVGLLVLVMALVAFANLIDFGFRTMAQEKAQRAEAKRFAQWGLPAPKPAEPPRDERVWHFNDEA